MFEKSFFYWLYFYLRLPGCVIARITYRVKRKGGDVEDVDIIFDLVAGVAVWCYVLRVNNVFM